MMEKVALQRGETLEIETLLAGLHRYEELKASASELGQKREKLAALVKLKKSVKEKIEKVKEELWRLEENELRQLLDLQNCDETSLLESRLIASKGDLDEEEAKLTHQEVGVKHGLVTFTEDGGYYLHNDLAMLELKLVHRFSSLALLNEHFPVSAPDFSKSVVLEGCGVPYFDPNSSLSLRPGGECGEAENGTALHLVGGASVPALVAYFARNVLNSPNTVLPVVLSCQGRSYSPPAPPSAGPHDLVSGRQSTAMASLAVCATRDDAELQFEKFCQFAQAAIAFMPNFRLEEQDLAQCSKSDVRRVALFVKGKELIEVGHVALQGDYFSRRLMLRQKTSEETLEPLYTATMQLSITRMLACVLELSQGDSEKLAELKTALT